MKNGLIEELCVMLLSGKLDTFLTLPFFALTPFII